MPRAFFALLVLVAGLGVALWFVAGVGRERPGADGAASDEAATPLADLTPRPTAPDASAPVDAAAIEPADESAPGREALRDGPVAELGPAQWVEGRVLLPAGTPADERLFVTGGSWDDDARLRTEVAPDGTFRLAFPEGRRSGRIALVGRYLYLKEAAAWELDALPVVIEPELGGRIEVRVRAPGSVTLTNRVELRRDEDSPAWADAPLGARVPEGGVASFDGLEPRDGYVVSYGGDGFVALSADEVVPGRTQELELELHEGVVLAGTVRDEEGAPVAGARISLFSSFARIARDVDTPAEGNFQFDALWPGKVTLHVQREGFRPCYRELGDLPAGTRREDVELSRGGSIAGRVRTPDGAPIAAQIELLLRVDDAGLLRFGETRECKSADDGSFRVAGLAPGGEYLVRASAEAPGSDALPHRERPQLFVEVERVATGTENLKLELASGQELVGRVRDDLGRPLTDFRVSARRAVGSEGVLGRSFDAPDGSFVWKSFQAGDWDVSATADGYARSDVVRASVPSLAPVALVLPREARVRGVVVDPRGVACARASVGATQPDLAPELQWFGGWNERPSDDDGAFELVGLRPGRLVLWARGENGAPSERVELDLAAGDVVTDVVLALRAGGTIRGEVLGSDGQPLPGLFVSLHPTSIEHCVTDGEGRFAATNVPPGSITVGTTTRDGFGLSQTVELDAGETKHVHLEMPRATSVRLHGTLTAGGEALAGASVYAHRASDARDEGSQVSPPQAQSDAEGRYELTLPGSGSYWLNIGPGGFDSGGISWNVPLEVPDTAEHDFDVAIPVGRISGRVRGISGEPLARVVVESEPVRHDNRGHGSARTRTDEEGRYELLVPVGFHVVCAGVQVIRGGAGTEREPRYIEDRSHELSIAAGANVRGIDFVLRSGGAVAGRVRDSAGHAVSGSGVWVSVPEGWRAVVWTDDDGAFRIGGLEPGARSIRATGQATVSRSAQVVVVEGETAEVELVLESGTSVHVRTHDPAGNALGCEMEIVDAEGFRVPLRTMGQGEGLAGPLIPGRYRILAQREQRRIERDLEIAAGQAPLDVELVFD